VDFPSPISYWAFGFVAQSTWYDDQEYGIAYRSDENRYRIYSYNVKDCANCADTFWTDYGISFRPGDIVWMKVARCQTTLVCGSYSRDGSTWYAIDNGIRKGYNDINSYGEVVANRCGDGGLHPTISSFNGEQLEALDIRVRMNNTWYSVIGSEVWDPATHYAATKLSPTQWYAYGGGQQITC